MSKRKKKKKVTQVNKKFVKNSLHNNVWSQFDPALFDVTSCKATKDKSGTTIVVSLVNKITGVTFSQEYLCY